MAGLADWKGWSWGYLTFVLEQGATKLPVL